jgi:hypothetical protein
MTISARIFRLLGFGAILALTARAQTSVVAPASLASCLVKWTTTTYGVIYLNGASGPSTVSSSEVILYNLVGTWTELNTTDNTTSPLESGTWTYSVSGSNPAQATLSYGQQGNGTPLYFTSANQGQTIPPNSVIPTILPYSITSFTIYPLQSANGGVNFSNRCQLTAGGTAISGFVVQSGGPRWVLFRAAGSTLGNFGLTQLVASPSFTLYNAAGTVVGTSTVWSANPYLAAGYESVFSMVGAFPLNAGSDEGVLLVSLNPGAYTAQFSASSAGTILCEAYLLPY